MKQKQMRKIINLVKEKWNNLKTLEKIMKDSIDFIAAKDAIANTDLLILLVPHTEFKELFQSINNDLQVLDYCGLLHRPR